MGGFGWVSPASVHRGALSRGAPGRERQSGRWIRIGSAGAGAAGPRRESSGPFRQLSDYFLRWRILLRIRRFLRPILRRPLPDFFVPIWFFARSALVPQQNAVIPSPHLQTGTLAGLTASINCRVGSTSTPC